MVSRNVENYSITDEPVDIPDTFRVSAQVFHDAKSNLPFKGICIEFTVPNKSIGHCHYSFMLALPDASDMSSAIANCIKALT